MALIQMSFLSTALKRTVPVTVVLPVDNTAFLRDTPRFPTLYLLHGLLGSHTDWVCNTRIQKWAEERGLAVVMPSGDNSFYIDQLRPSGQSSGIQPEPEGFLPGKRCCPDLPGIPGNPRLVLLGPGDPGRSGLASPAGSQCGSEQRKCLRGIRKQQSDTPPGVSLFLSETVFFSCLGPDFIVPYPYLPL